jgi:hypothetical protein
MQQPIPQLNYVPFTESPRDTPPLGHRAITRSLRIALNLVPNTFNSFFTIIKQQLQVRCCGWLDHIIFQVTPQGCEEL